MLVRLGCKGRNGLLFVTGRSGYPLETVGRWWHAKLYRGHGIKVEEMEQDELDSSPLKGPEKENELPENPGLALNDIYLRGWLTSY